MNDSLLLSVIIPCRNEERHIVQCLDSIISSDFPKDLLEILVVDGRSSDGTVELLRQRAIRYPFVRLVDNEKKTTPHALNLGIRHARGKYVLILSSHSIIEKNFLKENVISIGKHDADCVGGRLVTLPANDSIGAQAIASAISNPFGVGNAHFRIGTRRVACVDTVPFGCYKRDVFERIGFFDEELIRNQDDELNFRIIKKGGKVLLNPDIVSYYYARDSLSKLSKMYYQYGYFKPLVTAKIGKLITWRQVIPSMFVAGLTLLSILALVSPRLLAPLIALVTIYSLANVASSFSIAVRSGWRLIFVLPIAFLIVHISYGIGYLRGILDFAVLRRQKRNKIEDVELTR